MRHCFYSTALLAHAGNGTVSLTSSCHHWQVKFQACFNDCSVKTKHQLAQTRIWTQANKNLSLPGRLLDQARSDQTFKASNAFCWLTIRDIRSRKVTSGPGQTETWTILSFVGGVEFHRCWLNRFEQGSSNGTATLNIDHSSLNVHRCKHLRWSELR